MQRLALALGLSAILVIVSLALGSNLRQEPQRSSSVEANAEPGVTIDRSSDVAGDESGDGGATGFGRGGSDTAVGQPGTSSTLPSSSTTADPARQGSSSTTTTPKPSNGNPPTTIPVNGSGQCILDQIAREPFKNTGDAKTKFDIIVNDIDTSINLWTAPYKVDLGNGWGWISGDRSGYKGGYMFLVNRGTGQVVARVLFHQVEGAAYIQINDAFMDEIQTTGIGYDGTCADGSSSDPRSQAQTPNLKEKYDVDSTVEVRPKIPMLVNGVLVEDRSYTNTVTPSIDFFRFTDLGKTTKPFTDYNGVGGTPHTVYQRQRVGGLVDKGDGFKLAVVVYYDWLVPYGTFG
jgi:hypothetical protein